MSLHSQSLVFDCSLRYKPCLVLVWSVDITLECIDPPIPHCLFTRWQLSEDVSLVLPQWSHLLIHYVFYTALTLLMLWRPGRFAECRIRLCNRSQQLFAVCQRCPRPPSIAGQFDQEWQKLDLSLVFVYSLFTSWHWVAYHEQSTIKPFTRSLYNLTPR